MVPCRNKILLKWWQDCTRPVSLRSVLGEHDCQHFCWKLQQSQRACSMQSQLQLQHLQQSHAFKGMTGALHASMLSCKQQCGQVFGPSCLALTVAAAAPCLQMLLRTVLCLSPRMPSTSCKRMAT
jgi:hypothetical protein